MLATGSFSGVSLRVGLLLSWVMAGCGAPPGPPPPPLPPPPSGGVRMVAVPRMAGPEADPSGTSRARGSGDHALDALRVGIEGCRVLGLRLDPSMNGQAEVTAEIGPNGEVLWVEATRVLALPRAVVQCLVDRVHTSRFEARGARMLVRVPVDFTRAHAPASPSQATPGSPAPRDLPPPGTHEI